MNKSLLGLVAIALLAGCGQQQEPETPATDEAATAAEAATGSAEVENMTDTTDGQVELAPGLQSTTMKNGYGRAAVAGDSAEVHYTGWLFDPNADGNRGTKFDSSVDRGQTFSFTIGEGRVIKGWDQGVAGMLIGETRELVIAPEMGYGARGAGGVIPPNATLLFEVELISLQGPGE